MIKGMLVQLRSATLDDRRTIYEWGRAPGIAPWIYLSGDLDQSFDDWCDDWKAYYFTDETPGLGQMFVILSGGQPVGAIAYNDIDKRNRVEIDIWMNSEANCGRGFGPDAIEALCSHLQTNFGVKTFMMQPSARNPRAIRAYEAGFAKVSATPEEIKDEWGGVDHHDSVLMIRETRP